MTTTRVERHNGLPAIFLNDRPISPITAYVGPRYVGTFSEAGVQLYTFNVRGAWWLGPGQYDFGVIDAYVSDYVTRIPDGYFMPRIDLARQGHLWWGELHPDEMNVLCSIETGEVISQHEADPRVPPYLGHEVHLEQLNLHSFHSTAWRAEAAQAVRDLVAHCEAQPYAERIWAWHLCAGLFCEWFHWNEYNLAGMADYSPAAVADFRRWLRVTYHDDVAELRQAWGREVDFDTATIPTPQERNNPYHGEFYDPVIDRPTVDYHQCMSDATVDSIIAVCQAAKSALPQPKVTCIFYGYQFSNMPRPQLNGHYALRRLLASDAVDMIASPHAYSNRGDGGYHSPQSMADVIRRAGKIHFDEIDCKTVWTPPSVTWKRHISQPTSVAGAIEMMKKDAAYQLASGTAQWWMDLTDQGWFDAPEVVEPIRRLRAIEERLQGMERKSFGEIALVVSQRSMMFMPPREGLHNATQKMFRNWHLSRVGAPFEQLFVEDLARTDLPPFKLYIMANLFYLSEQEREIIDCATQRQQRRVTALWVYAPALIRDASANIINMQRLTGLRFGADLVEAELDVEITRNDHPITEGLAIGMRYGTGVDREQYLRPPKAQYLPKTTTSLAFYAEEGWGQTLGRACSTGQPGLVVRELGGLQSVYSAAPVLSWPLLRNIARYAGVHLYTEGGHMVWGNNCFLAVYAQSDGEHVVRFPRPVDVEEAYDGVSLGQQVTEVTLPMKKWETRLLIMQ
jgi:hypothetical protein